MTTTPEQIDVWHILKVRPLPALLGLIFYLRDTPVETSTETVIQMNSINCLFKRLPLSACFPGKGGGND